jgi:hypothetical protein
MGLAALLVEKDKLGGAAEEEWAEEEVAELSVITAPLRRK